MTAAPTLLSLRAGAGGAAGPRFTRAELVPSRALMVYQLWADLPGRGETEVLAAPPAREGLARLDGGAQDFNGNAAFSMGAAFLAPFVNRIRGRHDPDRREIAATVAGRTVRLPANGGGSAPGAEQYAIHGLILDRAAEDVVRGDIPEGQFVTGTIRAGDFEGRWLSNTELTFRIELTAATFRATVTAQNAGREPLPIGLGWHPYFNLPSGNRAQARMRLPAAARLPVNDYDEVLPTGVIASTAGTPYDFSAEEGRALGDLYLDDCFVSLAQTADGRTVCEIRDPAAHYGLDVISTSPEVSALQTFAPLDRPFLVIEPQFSWADPYGPEWPPGTDTGMVVLQPGESVDYRVELRVLGI